MAWGGHAVATRQNNEGEQKKPFPRLGDNQTVDRMGRIVKHGMLNGHPQSWYVGSVLKSVEEADEWYTTYIKPAAQEIPNAVKMTNDMIRSVENLWDKFVPTCGVHGILEPLMEGLGMGLFSRMLRKHRDKLHKYMQWLTRDAVLHAKIAAETDFCVFNLADDQAYKNATMISVKDHDDLVIPYYTQICHEIRKNGKHIFFHSDGFTEPLFPGLIRAGFTGVESLEPMAGMNLKHLKENYGDKLCLIGNIDVSQTLPLGTPADVAAEVKKCIEDAAAGGGYIVSPCTDLTDAIPLENAEAMIAAVNKYGVYKK
jgi:uroporphyrinogen decarboxylase